ncbi:MAG: T9SS type A sorting domain-containing protein [Flavobacteriales bacterium]|nr:T9SS type A sorting domain-containing protein [Flavobacteriales bacterium]
MMLRSACAAAIACSASALLAQPNLTTSTSVPAPGLVVTVNTANAFQGPGPAGTNVQFNYWDMFAPSTGNQDITYLAPLSHGASLLIPSATLLSTDGGSDTLFWQVTASGLEMVGARTALEGTLEFNDPSLELKLPCTYGTTWSDATGDSYTVSSIPVIRTGTITGNADAYGTLHMPQGVTLPGVLRVHVRRAITDASAVVTTNRNSNIYYYYLETQAHPVVKLTEDSTQINNGGWAITMRQHSVGNPAQVGVGELDASEITFTPFPNPTSDLVNLSLSHAGAQARRLQVLDELGRVVMDETITTDKPSFSTRGLAEGLYTLRLLGAEGVLGTSRLVVH